MLNKYEYVIKTSDYVEQSLISRYPHIAPYTFHDKLAQLKGRLPHNTMRQLHTIRQQRNFIAHNEEYKFNWNAYDRALSSVHSWLGQPICYQVPVEFRQVNVTNVTRVVKENKKQVDAKNVLLAAGAGLAGLGLASLLGNNKKNPF